MTPLDGTRVHGPIVDCNVHLWDQRDNPVFWLSDRTLVREMLGDYDSLPETYTLGDYRSDTAGHDVRGLVWSDAGAADPVAAAASVQRQNDEHGLVVGIVTLADPAAPGFNELVDRYLEIPLVSSVRIRLVADLGGGSPGGETLPDDSFAMANLALLARNDLVATVEATSDQLGLVAELASALPELRIVIDHFGWPTDLTDAGLRQHEDRLGELAAAPNVATRIDALGTIFGSWTVADVRPWLLAATGAFGAERCMLGSDMPIERLRSGFGPIYEAYDEIFESCSGDERQQLLHGTAERWYRPARRP
jgi:predicted TIM-barrel fold metal-dependent hydrolase